MTEQRRTHDSTDADSSDDRTTATRVSAEYSGDDAEYGDDDDEYSDDDAEYSNDDDEYGHDDRPAALTTDSPTAPSAETRHSSDSPLESRTSDLRQYLLWGALGVCALLAVYSLIQFYGSVTAAIDLWVESQYRPIVHAAFNLVVLLCALAGVSFVVRELNDA